jgi:hypothetical protein
MARRALALGFGGYADLDLTFGEFFDGDHTVTVRFMPQHPYAGAGPLVAEASGSGIYLLGQGDYRWVTPEDEVGPAVLFVQVGGTKVSYAVPGFPNGVGGPVGYRGTWQHLAAVRQGGVIWLFLNGQALVPHGGEHFHLPATDLPSASTKVRLGRRSSGGSESKLYWQHYGLIDEVAIYTKALSIAEVMQAASAAQLTGSESGLLAGWTFDSGAQPAKLSRGVHLATAEDVPDHITAGISQPVPAYLVNVANPLDSAQDRKDMDRRPSKVRAMLPFGSGEWWRVSQGRETPGSSHNGGTAGYASDFVRINGETFGSVVFAAAPARVIYQNETAGKEAMSVYHAPFERATYMHLRTGFFSKYFAGQPFAIDAPLDQQPAFTARQPIAEVGPHDNGDHLHFTISSINGETWGGEDHLNAGPGLPVEITNYYVSVDEGATWIHVPQGVPLRGQWVAHYPWSPWGPGLEPEHVAPAVASRATGLLDVFVRGENGHLWQRSWLADHWGPWLELGGGRLTSPPAAIADRNLLGGPVPRLHVYVRGADQQLAERDWTLAGWGEHWRDLGGRLTSAPAVAMIGSLRYVFVRGHDHQLAYKRWNGEEWSEWRDLGGTLTSAPAAVSWGPGRIDVFARGADHQLLHIRWNGEEWSEWRDLGGRLTSGPAVSSWGPNRLDVFVRGHAGGLAQKRWNGTEWSEWRDLGGRLTSGPGAVSWGPNRIDVFVRGHDHQLAQKRWNGTEWSDWRDLDRNA